MGNDIKTSIVVDLKGNLDRQLKRNEANIKRFAKNSSRNLKGLSKTTKVMNGTFTSMGKKLGYIAVAAAAIKGINKTIEFDANLTQLQTDGQASVEQIAKLKKELIELANDPSIRLDKSVMLKGFDKIIAQTGDTENAMKNLRTLAVFMRATGTAGEDAGAMIAIAFKNGLTEVSQVKEFLGIQYKQSLMGSVPLREIAKTGKGLYSPITASVGASAQTLRDAGAVAQITIDAVKSADEAAEAIKALVSALNKKEVRKILGGAGIETRVKDSVLLRPLPDLIPEIYKVAKGDFGKLGKLFGESGVKVFQGYSKPRGAERLVELRNITADGSLIEKNARINAATAKAAKQSISNKYDKGMDFIFSGPTKDFARGLDTFERQGVLANANSAAEFFFDQFNVLADWTVGSIIRGTSGTKGFINNNEQPEARVILEIESKNATVKTKEIKTKGLQVDVDSALSVGGVK